MTKAFGSRGELLDWMNTLLGIQYSKVEEASNGAAFCQIMDALIPGKVKLHRVNYNARTEPEMVANYKILQEVLNSQNVSRNVPVESLTKGKCMASLEMLQWIKKYFDQHFAGGEYDGPARRLEVGIREPGEAKGARKVAVAPTGGCPPKTPKVVSARAVQPAPATAVKVKPIAAPATTRLPTPGKQITSQLQKLQDEAATLKKENTTLLEERNFYYEKLQKVETLCQVREGDDFTAQVLAVLYETDEGRGFVSPDELDI
jgi:RP/EB family microtubule-associated protein